jgi:hypothetical protein
MPNKTLLRWPVIAIGFRLSAYSFWNRYAAGA